MSENRAPEGVTVPAPSALVVKERPRTGGSGSHDWVLPLIGDRAPGNPHQVLAEASRGNTSSEAAAVTVGIPDVTVSIPEEVTESVPERKGTTPMPDRKQFKKRRIQSGLARLKHWRDEPIEPASVDIADMATTPEAIAAAPIPEGYYNKRPSRVKRAVANGRSKLWTPLSLPPDELSYATSVDTDSATGADMNVHLADAKTVPRPTKWQTFKRKARTVARTTAVASTMAATAGTSLAFGLEGMKGLRDSHDAHLAKDRPGATAKPFPEYQNREPLMPISAAEQARILGGELDPTLVETSREQNRVIDGLMSECAAPFQIDLTAEGKHSLAAKMYENMNHTQGRNIDTGATWHEGYVDYGGHRSILHVTFGENGQLQNATLTQGKVTETGAVIEPFEVTIEPVGIGADGVALDVAGYNIMTQAADPAEFTEAGVHKKTGLPRVATTAPTSSFIGMHPATPDQIAALSAFVNDQCGILAGQQSTVGGAEINTGSADASTAVLPGGKMGS